MTKHPSEGLAAKGLTMPAPAIPVANYVPLVVTSDLLLVSGQLPMVGGAVIARGRLGDGVDIDVAQKAAERCALNILAIVDHWGDGDWSRVVRCVRLGGFFQVSADFFDLSNAMNGASDLMVEALGQDGKHVRTTVGVATLPMNAVAEVEAIFAVKSRA